MFKTSNRSSNRAVVAPGTSKGEAHSSKGGGAWTETKLLQELQKRVLYLPTHIFHMIRFL